MKISVALLTKNGGSRLRECVEALRAERSADPPAEILAIDSGSRDGSVEFLRATPGVVVHEIDAPSFQHGRTRNLAMQLAKGELVAFLTQDAIPEPGWLSAHVRFMNEQADVAGTFGYQKPHTDADPLEAFEVTSHFDSFLGGPAQFQRPAAGSASESPEARARRHFFSNVNSCIRRSAWERVPFPEIDFGEDQAWAAAVHEAGMATGFVADAVVRHSHDYGPVLLFRRRFDESRFMRRQFGYALMPTLGQAVRTATAHTELFDRHLRAMPAARPAFLHGPRTRAWAAALGRWAGTRLAFDESWASRCLSLTENLRRA